MSEGADSAAPSSGGQTSSGSRLNRPVDPPSEGQPIEGLPTEQDLREALEKIKVSDVLVETMQGLASLGYHRLNAETRDLEQTRLAIEALKAIGGVLDGVVPAELTRDFNQVVANLQLAYASAAAESS
ncbi:MAG: hypothetical protein QOF50_2165 [Gaiellaceae bacterium]|nr:hypothetical protein [Gaiellaceae bacterium]MDX6519319.1 hypothetical protein [Gaiellaceae bacterium]